MDRWSWRGWCWLLVLGLLAVPRAVPAQPAFVQPNPTVVPVPGTGGYPIRYTVMHDIGSGVGYEDSFTRLGMELP
jgi:hypothetical protein